MNNIKTNSSCRQFHQRFTRAFFVQTKITKLCFCQNVTGEKLPKALLYEKRTH